MTSHSSWAQCSATCRLGWTLPQRVARQLNAEFRTAFTGHADPGVALRLAVDREPQRLAIACHHSQSVANPVLWRRLELLGDAEYLRILRTGALCADRDSLSDGSAAMNYGTSIRLQARFAETADRVRRALKEQGFGVLTEIDVRATLREKLGEDMEDYLILGACNPPLAHRALQADGGSGCCCRAPSWCAPTATRPSWRHSTPRSWSA
jgi:uncharacterized protein DUF302